MNIVIVKSNESHRDGNPMFEIKPSHLKMIKQVLPGAKIKVIEDSPESINKNIRDAEIAIASAVGGINLNIAPGLKWLHVTSAGVNRLSEEIIKSDLFITNSSGVHPVPIAEHVFCFMLMFARALNVSYKNQLINKRWMRDFNILPVFELYGKTLLIAGLGRIGRRIAEIGKAFGMRVIGVVRNPNRKEQFTDLLLGGEDLDKGLKEADFVVNALPATYETHKLFNLSKFKKMKSSAYFINIGRGLSVNEEDLVKALKSQMIAGAGLDVTYEEPLPANSKLWELPNVIITPHYSGWTPYYMDRVIEIFVENLKAFIQKKPMPNLIDKGLGY